MNLLHIPYGFIPCTGMKHLWNSRSQMNDVLHDYIQAVFFNFPVLEIHKHLEYIIDSIWSHTYIKLKPKFLDNKT